MAFAAVLASIVGTVRLVSAQEATYEPGAAPRSAMMSDWLKAEALAALDRRITAYEALQTPEQLAEWQRERREFFLRKLGGLPERSPLNATITGRADFDGYRIEKLHFESQPGFHVSATMYLPDGEGPFPGVLHIPGHSTEGKARDLYQRAAIVIARGGCAVLSYDPVGQGERHHFHDDTQVDGGPRVSSTTQEHQLFNQGAILLGSNTARLMVWDATRAIDYLQSRDDILADRIGCTGISGGGTNTSYIMALDERIVAAAPGCYLCGFRSLLERQGPQDAEQNIHGQIAFGMDHGDYVMMRAPQPTLIMAATRDYFDIEGAWRLFRRSKRFYTRMGFPERCELVEPDTEHGFPTEMRVAAANWMRRWLLDDDTPIREEDFPILSEEELHATPTGRVLDLPGAKSAFDLHAEWAETFAAERAANALPERRESLRDTVFALTGAREPNRTPGNVSAEHLADKLPAVSVFSTGAFESDFARAGKLRISTERGIDLSAVLFSPLDGSRPETVILHLNDAGFSVDTGPDGVIAELMKAPKTAVLAVDLRGYGDTATPASRAGFDKLIGADWRETTIAMLLEKSYVGLRVDDIAQCLAYLLHQFDGPRPIYRLNAVGAATIPALHAAFLHPDEIDHTTLTDGLASWIELVGERHPPSSQADLIFGALRHYDLPTLIKQLGSDKVTVQPAP